MNLTKDVWITDKEKNSFIVHLNGTIEDDVVLLELSNDDHKLQRIKAYGDTFFGCLLKIRAELEENGFLILCLGSSINVWPSGMTSQMNRGLKAYKRKLGQQTALTDMVNIFDPATEEEVGTIEEQRLFSESWVKSLGK